MEEVAGHDAGIGIDELDLAARNHAMPHEALRSDITPIGLHYLLTHYDIPDVDPGSFRLTIDGHVARPCTLTLEQLRAAMVAYLESTLNDLEACDAALDETR